jgi:propanediol dehydratase small subunit
LKDYCDLSVLLEREDLDPAILAKAIAATFTRRGTALPAELPIGLTDEFANDASRQALWTAFLRKNELTAVPLQDVVMALRTKLQPGLAQAALVGEELSSR